MTTTPLLRKTHSEIINELLSNGDYEGIKTILSEKKEEIGSKLRTRVLVDFLMLANTQSDPMYGSTDLKKAKLFFKYAIWIKKSGETSDFQGNTNVAQMMEALSTRFSVVKERVKASCCRCM